MPVKDFKKGKGAGGDVRQGGNSFGTSMIIGTNDNQSFLIKQNNINRLSINTQSISLLHPLTGSSGYPNSQAWFLSTGIKLQTDNTANTALTAQNAVGSTTDIMRLFTGSSLVARVDSFGYYYGTSYRSTDNTSRIHTFGTGVEINRGALTGIPLSVTTPAGFTNSLTQWRVDATTVSQIDYNGYYCGPGIRSSNLTSLVNTTASGVEVSRSNIAGIPLSVIAPAGFGGSLTQWRIDATTVAQIDQNGYFCSVGMRDNNSGNFRVKFGTNGAEVESLQTSGVPLRVIAPTGFNGSIQEWRVGGSIKARVTAQGQVFASEFGSEDIIGGFLRPWNNEYRRDIADALPTFTINQFNGSGPFMEWSRNGVAVSRIDSAGRIDCTGVKAPVQAGDPVWKFGSYASGNLTVEVGGVKYSILAQVI